MTHAIQWFQFAYDYSLNNNILCMQIIGYYLPIDMLRALQYANQLQFKSSDQKELRTIKQFIIEHFLKDLSTIEEITKKGVLQKNQHQLQKQKLGVNLVQRYNKLLKALINIDKHYYQEYISLATNLFLLNKFQEALSWCQKLRQLNPLSADIQLQLAANYGLLHDYNSAVGCYKQALRINPTFQSAYCIIIPSLIGLKRLRQAKQYAQRWLNLNPNNSKAFFQMGSIFYQQKNYELARRYLLKSISKNNNNYMVHQQLGDTYCKLNRIEEAIQAYKTSIKIHPVALTYNKIAYCHLFKGDWLKLFECCKQAIKIDYQFDASYFNLAVLYNHCNNNILKRNINQFMEKFRSLHKNNLIVQYNSNIFYKKTKHPKFCLYLQQMIDRMITIQQQKQLPQIQLINNITMNYQNLNQGSKKDIQQIIVIGLLWQIKKKPFKSNQIYDKLMRPHQQLANQNIKQAFFSFFKQIILKQSTIMQSLSLQFILKQMKKDYPTQTTECFMKIVDFTPFAHDFISFQLSQNYYQETSIIDQLCELVEKMQKEQFVQAFIQLQDRFYSFFPVEKNHFDNSALIKFLQNIVFMHSLISIWSNIVGDLYKYDLGIQIQIKRILYQHIKCQIPEEESDKLIQNNQILKFDQIVMKLLLKSIEWNEEIQHRVEFCELIDLIKAQEQQYFDGVLNYMRLYPTEEDIIPLITGISIHMSEYFQDKYLINQLCKIILSQLSPYLFHYQNKGTVKLLCNFILDCKRNNKLTLVVPFLYDIFEISKPNQSIQIVNPKRNERYQIIDQSDEQWSADIEEYKNKYDLQISVPSNNISLNSQNNQQFYDLDLKQSIEEHLNNSCILEGQKYKKNQMKQNNSKGNIKDIPEKRIEKRQSNKVEYLNDEGSDQINEEMQKIQQIQQKQHEDKDNNKNIQDSQKILILNFKQIQYINANILQSDEQQDDQNSSFFGNEESQNQQSYQSSYTSSISHHTQQNQVVKFLKTINKNQNIPIVYKANKAMRQSFFENTNNIILYLSANNSKFHHIARHFTRQQTLLRKDGFKHSKDRSFSFLIQMGDKNYSNYSGQGSLAYYLWRKGLKYVIEWIISLAKGISELEEFGIFHCDLHFRNTIKIGQSFKIIDFDRAFVVKKLNQNQQNNKAFKSTKEIIKIWLQNQNQPKQHEQDFISSIFYKTNDHQLVQKLLNQKYKETFSVLSATVHKIMNLLSDYMYKSHLDQFYILITGANGLLCMSLVDKFREKLENHDELVASIIQATNKLFNRTIKYKAFWQQIQKIQRVLTNI